MENINPNLDDFYETWHWLSNHPYYFSVGSMGVGPCFEGAYDVDVVAVDENGLALDGDERAAKPFHIEVWLESGAWYEPKRRYHDPSLDCGGPTFEAAILALGRLMMDKHGDYPLHRRCSHCFKYRPAGPTDSHREWFCSASCKECGAVGLVTEPVPGNRPVVRWVPPAEQFDCEHWKVK